MQELVGLKHKHNMATQEGIVCIQSSTSPNDAKLGDEWFNTTTNRMYKRVFVNGSVQWIELLMNQKFVLSNWTTTTRPTILTQGQIGFNSTLNKMESYINSSWTSI